MRARSEFGVVGNPEAGSAEKGAEIVKRAVDRVVAFVHDEFGG